MEGEECGSEVSLDTIPPQAVLLLTLPEFPAELPLPLTKLPLLLGPEDGAPGWLQILEGAWLDTAELPPTPVPSCPKTGQAEGLALGFKFKLKLEEPQVLAPNDAPLPSLFPSPATAGDGPEPQPLLTPLWLERIPPEWLLLALLG